MYVVGRIEYLGGKQDAEIWSGWEEMDWETGTGEGFQPVQAMERCLCFRQDLELSPQASWLLLWHKRCGFLALRASFLPWGKCRQLLLPVECAVRLDRPSWSSFCPWLWGSALVPLEPRDSQCFSPKKGKESWKTSNIPPWVPFISLQALKGFSSWSQTCHKTRCLLLFNALKASRAFQSFFFLWRHFRALCTKNCLF